MHIKELKLDSFRNFSTLSFSPNSNLNIIYGENGAGKSSILEAIYVLSFGRSFRSSKLDSIVNYETSQATAYCQFQENDKIRKLGYSRLKSTGNTISIDGSKTSRISEIARIIPVQLFTPQSSDLIIGAPVGRRRYIDWLLFHVEHEFNDINKKYLKCMQQRNALLKLFDFHDSKLFSEQDVWLDQLAELGEKITNFRKHYIDLLNVEISVLFEQFYPELKFSMRYNTGWDKDKSLKDCMLSKVERDLFRGSCGYGPHKADIQFIVSEKSASEFLSRGQLRLLVSVLLLAEVKVLNRIKNKNTIFLIDDISAELDEDKREKFINAILENDAQVFITAIEKQQVSFLDKYKNKKMFHVKHNHVKEER